MLPQMLFNEVSPTRTTPHYKPLRELLELTIVKLSNLSFGQISIDAQQTEVDTSLLVNTGARKQRDVSNAVEVPQDREPPQLLTNSSCKEKSFIKVIRTLFNNVLGVPDKLLDKIGSGEGSISDLMGTRNIITRKTAFS